MPRPVDATAIDPSSPDGTHAARAAAMHAEAGRVQRAARGVGVMRLAMFAAIVLALAAAAAYPAWRALHLALAASAALVLLRLVAQSERLAAARARATTLAAIHEQALARIARDWSAVPRHPLAAAAGDDPIADDLNLFGEGSLGHLLPPLSRAHGAPLMRAWLTEAAAPDAILARQHAAREMIPLDALREELVLTAVRSHVSAETADRFAEWSAERGADLPRWLAVASYALPAALLALFALEVAGVLRSPWWLVPVFAGVAATARARRRVRPVLLESERMSAVAEGYARVFGLLERQAWSSERLVALQAVLRDARPVSAEAAMRRLGRLGAWAGVRASPMLHGMLQLTLLWDCHVARALARWRREVGGAVGAWFAALGELECLAAFAGLAADNPEFTFPHVAAPAPAEEGPRIKARALGHPLLPVGARVANDVAIGPAGTVLLVSGSNMSGKSTLLRTVGLNVVLALSGGPVCAASMTCPPVRLRTSIHVRDSLSRGLSYFMAEVTRLREIVTAANDVRDGARGPVLYLIDEMLSGTNSEERAVAVRLIVDRLLATTAIGVITTHDLPAFCVEPIASRTVHAHFRERVSGEPGHETMDFDYRLYDGSATSRNALRLLALAGLVPPR